MSWVRWGSPCWGTGGYSYEVDAACAQCPGSDVYVYDDVAGGLTCCGCILSEARTFSAHSPDAMRAHLRDHVAAGHHVRPSLMLTEDEASRAACRMLSPAEMDLMMRALDERREIRLKAFFDTIERSMKKAATNEDGSPKFVNSRKDRPKLVDMASDVVRRTIERWDAEDEAKKP